MAVVAFSFEKRVECEGNRCRVVVVNSVVVIYVGGDRLASFLARDGRSAARTDQNDGNCHGTDRLPPFQVPSHRPY